MAYPATCKTCGEKLRLDVDEAASGSCVCPACDRTNSVPDDARVAAQQKQAAERLIEEVERQAAQDREEEKCRKPEAHEQRKAELEERRALARKAEEDRMAEAARLTAARRQAASTGDGPDVLRIIVWGFIGLIFLVLFGPLILFPVVVLGLLIYIATQVSREH
jgi:hypothetical protein